jgi:recombination protein RecT
MPESKEVIEIKTDTRMEKIANCGIALTPEQVAVVKSTVAKGTTDLELAYFLNVCHSVGLNPFLKEIWCYKDKKGNVLVFAGRDGFLSKAQSNPRYAGIRSCEIREKDEFSVDVANKAVTHKIVGWGNDRGKIKGAYCIVFIRDGEPTIEIADFDTYNKGWNAWKTHPAEMIKKVAETHALKKALGITGLQVEDDFDIKNGVVSPLALDAPKSLTDEVEFYREGVQSDLMNEEWLKIVTKTVIGKSTIETKGEAEAIRKAIFDNNDFDPATGEKIPE